MSSHEEPLSSLRQAASREQRSSLQAQGVFKEYASQHEIAAMDFRPANAHDIAVAIEQAAHNMGFAICGWGSSSAYNQILQEDGVDLTPLGEN